MRTYLYAAYGSNLHPVRLQNRVSSAVLIGTSYLPHYSLKFNKRSSNDGSAKCNISAGGSGVCIAVYELSAPDRSVLDKIEGVGHGYDSREIELDDFGPCSIYVATPDVIDETLHPFDWYRDYVVHGARFHGFPANYIAPLQKMHAIPDDNVRRAASEWSQIEQICASNEADTVSVRDAFKHEAQLLSALALRSKSHWGYSPAFIASCKDELTYDAWQICDDGWKFVVAEKGTMVVGFYALEKLSAQEYELEALFVEPSFIGKGIGRTLIKHAIHSVAKLGGKCVLIQGDPNAEAFYLAAGAEKIGESESGSIPGRFLPLFKIRIQSSTEDSPANARGDL